MTKLTSFVVAGVLAACGGGSNKTAATTPATAPAPVATAPAAPAGAWELGEIKFYQGDEMGLQLHANGHLEVKMTHAEPGKPPESKWQDVGSLAADGTLSGADGQKHAMLKPDGSVVTPDGQTAPFHLEGETLVVADKKLSIDDKGMLQGAAEAGTTMRIEGASTPGLKRTALIVLAIVMSSPDPH
jgi:hypothetical protein